MSTHRTKKVVALAALGVFAFTGGVAIAYYTTEIDTASAAGQASISPDQAQAIVATFTSAATGLVPGGPAQTLTLSLTNGNDYAVAVGGKTLSLDLANMTTATPNCTNAVALLSAQPVALTGAAQVFAKGETKSIDFVLSMGDSTTVDQTPCIGAEFTVPVVVSNTV